MRYMSYMYDADTEKWNGTTQLVNFYVFYALCLLHVLTNHTLYNSTSNFV